MSPLVRKAVLLGTGILAMLPPVRGAEPTGHDWWSLRPLVRPSVPSAPSNPELPAGDAARARTPIDHFILAKLRAEGLTLSPEADRRTLVRRLYFDLTGLPPTPDEVASFVADEGAGAYDALVDKLLASPRYGERWARHWLDVVHYADTHGYDKDQPRPNAWPYRDYVIRAFNEDRPYARFVREQLAGDVLYPGSPDGIVATGFIAAGPWDLIGHAEVPEEKIDGQIARHLDRDDMAMTTMNTFTSLTVQCAQCHDHKRDPVSMQEYYRLQAVFAAVDRADRTYDSDPAVARQRASLSARMAELDARLAEIDTAIDSLKPEPLLALEQEIATLEAAQNAVPQEPEGGGPAALGYHSEVAASQDTEKWVQVDLGRSVPIDDVLLFGAGEYGFSDFGFPVRFRIEASDDAEFATGVVPVEDASDADYPRPGAGAARFSAQGTNARHLRVTATKLWNRHRRGEPETGDWIFALGELAIVSSGNVVPAAAVHALDSIEAAPRWTKANLTDGTYGVHGTLADPAAPSPSPTNGFHSEFSPVADAPKWVSVDLGHPSPIDRIALVPARPTDFPDTPGFGFPLRFRVETAAEAGFANPRVIADHTREDFANPGEGVVEFSAHGATGRYVRVVATRLWKFPSEPKHALALAELRVFAGGAERSLGAAVDAADSIEQGLWSTRHLVDGYDSRKALGGDATPLLAMADAAAAAGKSRLAALVTDRDAALAKVVPVPLLAERDGLVAALAETDGALAALPPQSRVYAGTVHTGSGTFKGTGASGGQPRTIHVLDRGDVRNPLEEVGPGAPAVIPGTPSAFALPDDHHEGARRAALAEWITSPDNPLTWRSIVNRVWLYHFGNGIVDSANDFGRMGQLPTQPELLDWLAVEFRDGGQSLKDLHRLMVTSAVYRQSSLGNEEAEAADAGNQFLWRMNRRKLEAEALRDGMLQVAGDLDTTMFGPGFQDFVIEKPENSPHYQYRLFDVADPTSYRRSIYRFVVRSQPQPFLDTLDCADPALLVDKRNETLTALQALALLNNRFAVHMAERFAGRLEREIPDDPVAQVGRAYALALARQPAPDEADALLAYHAKHGLPAVCRLIFNLNEFAFVE